MTDYERIEKVIRFIEANFQAQPSLAALAKEVGLSESHFHRLFTRWAGTTPKSFLQFLTSKHAKQMLLESRDLLSVALESGLSGPSRLHDLLISTEAVTPGEFKAKGLGVEIKYGIHPTPFGLCVIGITKRGVCHLEFVDSNDQDAIVAMKTRWPNAFFKHDRAETAKAVKQIFLKEGRKRVSVLLKGTPFQMKVWEALLKIPEGHIVSYADLAKLAGVPGASRAVGTAIAKNSVAYLIPCHRVIRETGSFGEYRWGPSRKRALITWERAKLARAGR